MLTTVIISALLVFGFAVIVLTSIAVKVLRHFSHRRLEVRCRARRKRSLFGEILGLHDEAAMAVEKLRMVTLVLLIAGASLTFAPWLETLSGLQLAGLVVVVLLVMLVVTVWIPWSVVRHGSAPFLISTWWLWRLVCRLFWPARLGLSACDAVFRRLAGQPKRDDKEEEEEAFEDEIMTMVKAGQREGLLEPDAREMIEGVMELGDADVADIMTPRSQVDALDVDLGWPEILQTVIESGRTRLPVYQKSLDNVIGVLYVKDLLTELAHQPGTPEISLRQKLRKPWFVPPTIPLDDLLQDFLENRIHLAVVLDEYGALEGVVTIEDVLEEIVGEIMDESDEAEDEGIIFFNEHRSKAMGFVHIDAINERLNTSLPESDDYDTVGGFVISQLGRLPAKGESIEHEGVRLTVVETAPNKVVSVLVESADQAQPRNRRKASSASS